MILRPCKCGHLPSIIRNNDKGIDWVRVECACGLFGGTVMFTKPEQRDWAEQTVADGWNLAD